MEQTITISKAQVETAIRNTTGHTGLNREKGVDRIAITDDEQPLVGDLTERAILDLLPKLAKYAPQRQGFEVVLNLPANFNEGVLGLLSDAVTAYVTNQVLAAWFVAVGQKEDAAQYQAESNRCLTDMIPLLCSRIKP